MVENPGLFTFFSNKNSKNSSLIQVKNEGLSRKAVEFINISTKMPQCDFKRDNFGLVFEKLNFGNVGGRGRTLIQSNAVKDVFVRKIPTAKTTYTFSSY